MKHKIGFSFAIFIFIFLIFENGYSQQNAIPRSVLGSGGAQIGDANNRINGTVGQAIIGITQNTINKKYLGFWYTKDIKTDVTNMPAPQAITLSQNYPNPLSLSTDIATTFVYSIDRTTDVDISIYDQMGRKVAILTSGMQSAGSYSVQFAPDAKLPSGMYTALLKTTRSDRSIEMKSRIMILIK